jgi:hypothetical protein
MAWGGPEEQAKERDTGNPNAKNWHDEALKVVETTMEEYWIAHKALVDSGRAPANTIDNDSTVLTVKTMESEYDRHRRMLVQQAVYEHNAGWAAELRRYLKDMPDNVSKETDIVQWWVVSLSNMFQHTFYLISHRDIHLYILPLRESQWTFVPYQHLQSHVNDCFQQAQRLQQIAAQDLVQTNSSNSRSSSICGEIPLRIGLLPTLPLHRKSHWRNSKSC